MRPTPPDSDPAAAPRDGPQSSVESGAVVRRAQQGDVAAFEQLYREHAGSVHALCLRLTGDAARADELTQDVFVRAWRRLGTFRGECALSSWLHRLAVNAMLEDARAERRRTARVRPVEDLSVVEGAADGPGPEAGMDLERAIAALPPGARLAFVLHDIEGYRHEEIAAQAGIAVGTSKAQLHRARKLLMRTLER